MRPWSAFRVLALTVLVLSQVFGAGATLAQEKDPWQRAVEEAQTLFRANPEFGADLEEIRGLLTRLDEQLAVVESAQPLLDLFDQLKTRDVFLVGNAWEVLVKTLNTASPGAGTALERLDQALRLLLKVRMDLRDWNRRLEPLQDAYLAFQQSPSPERLQVLDTVATDAIQVIDDMNQQIVEVQHIVQEVLRAGESVKEGLGLVAGVGLPDGLDQAVIVIREGIDRILGALYQVNGILQDARERLDRDRGVLVEIQNIVYQAQHPQVNSDPTRMGEGFRAGGGNWLGVGVLVAGLGAGLWVAFVLNRRTRSQLVAPRGESKSSAGELYGASASQQRLPLASDAPPVLARPARGQTQAVLEAVSGPLAGRQWVLDRQDVLLGRGRDCVIRIPDLTVSRRHARLRYAQGTWFIQDQGSKGGTFVNGRRVMAARLQPEDTITIGKTILIFRLR